MKLWGGRFSEATDKIVDDFNSSIRFDQRLYYYDIKGSIAHARMLGNCSIIPEEEAEMIITELNAILKDIEEGKIEFEVDAEDIHMNIEKILIDRIGDVGKKLHTGRSRNDQVALDIRMFLKEETTDIINMVKELMTVLVNIADKQKRTIMPGYTHLQRAQPVTLAHHMLAYFEMFKRDIERLKDCHKRMDSMPLGSGALAGTTYPMDREMVRKELNFSSLTLNSLDGVSDRDFVIELASCLSILMMHLSRFSEEIILWASLEFGFITLSDSYSTGSSIMPQKKNPDVAELVRGKTGRVYGSLMALLTVMKGLPLAYNKDMQEDKEAIFDCVDTLKMCLPVFTRMLETCSFNTDTMYKAAQKGFTNATDFADYLVKKGIPFRQAHEITGNLVRYCIERNLAIEDVPLEELKELSGSAKDLIDEDIYNEISLEKCVEGRNLTGGTAPENSERHIKLAQEYLDSI
ncbi:MAG TPA: argininosuccinate lyase [Clostridiaceae bacterium]|jgi:argininosuccinate lyase|nr:argininosuccinate lyase [Clostridiaceae bacterium]